MIGSSNGLISLFSNKKKNRSASFLGSANLNGPRPKSMSHFVLEIICINNEWEPAADADADARLPAMNASLDVAASLVNIHD